MRLLELQCLVRRVARAETAVAVAFPVVVWMVEIAAVAAVAAVAAGAVVDRVEEDWVLADLGEVAMVVRWVVVALVVAGWVVAGGVLEGLVAVAMVAVLVAEELVVVGSVVVGSVLEGSVAGEMATHSAVDARVAEGTAVAKTVVVVRAAEVEEVSLGVAVREMVTTGEVVTPEGVPVGMVAMVGYWLLTDRVYRTILC